MRCPAPIETLYIDGEGSPTQREFAVCNRHAEELNGGAAWRLDSSQGVILMGSDIDAGDLLYFGFSLFWDNVPAGGTKRRLLTLIGQSSAGKEEEFTVVISDDQLRALAEDLVRMTADSSSSWARDRGTELP